MLTIKFFGAHNPYGFLSNFYYSPFKYKSPFADTLLRYSTVEHMFQAYKFIDNPEHFERIRLANEPAQTKRLGRQKKPGFNPEWPLISTNVMKRALWAKFTQNYELKMSLIHTHDAILIENSPYDAIWGVGPNGDGENRLGHLLMLLRTRLLTTEY